MSYRLPNSQKSNFATEPEEHPASKRFGFVQTLNAKPKRRLFEVLKAQGMQLNQQITFLSDGSDTVRDLQLSMSPEAEPMLDWHHITMRLTVLDQYAPGLVHYDRELGRRSGRSSSGSSGRCGMATCTKRSIKSKTSSP